MEVWGATSRRTCDEGDSRPALSREGVAADGNGLAQTDARHTALRFLSQLFRGKPADAYVLIWQLRGKRSHWFRDVAQAADLIAQHHDEDLYVGVGLSAANRGPNERCKASDTAGIAALWIDFDVAGPAHKKKNLPPTMEDALALIPSDLTPTTVIHTGHGVQGWWNFKEPWLFSNNDDRLRAADLARCFNRLFQTRAGERGWSVDSVADLARVLRIPGTTNTKLAGAECEVLVHRGLADGMTHRNCRRTWMPQGYAACSVTAPEVNQPRAGLMGLRWT